jgi:hypothetical protein
MDSRDEASNNEVLNIPDFKALYDQLENEELKKVFLTMTPDQALYFFGTTMNVDGVHIKTIVEHQDDEMIEKVAEYILKQQTDRKTADRDFRNYLEDLD